MFVKKIVGWDALADSIIAACWRTDRRYVNRHTRTMLKALRTSVEKKELDLNLIENLTRLAHFCCLEGNYSKAARLYETVLKAQERVLTAENSASCDSRLELATINRIRSEKSNWALGRGVDMTPVTEAVEDNFEDHIYFLTNQAA